MAIDFSPDRWARIRDNYRLWWDGTLERPLISLTLWGRDPGRPAPKLPMHHFTALYDPAVSAEEIVDVWDYHLSCVSHLGDAFPHIWPNFGPGVAAAFMGARLVPANDTVWFQPDHTDEIRDIRLGYRPDNMWLERVKAICRTAMQRWQGMVQVGMTDLGGASDIVHTFRHGERLLLDMFDDPQSVERLIGESHELWWKYFDEINAVLRPTNPGYTAWTPIFSETPYYMLQSDVSYMLGPRQFQQFVEPELAQTCRKLSNAFYHLDGIGQLCHLDRLLAIPELKGIQWVPGAGQPDVSEWPQVYGKILRAGKRTQIFGDARVLDTIEREVGSARNVILHIGMSIGQKDEALALLRKYDIEP